MAVDLAPSSIAIFVPFPDSFHTVICSRYDLPVLEELASSNVQGLLSSMATVEELGLALSRLAAGGAEAMLQHYVRVARRVVDAGTKEPLSPREREIVQLVATDLSDREIARRLSISARTVSNHLRHIYAKLGVKGRAGAVATAIAHSNVAAEW